MKMLTIIFCMLAIVVGASFWAEHERNREAAHAEVIRQERLRAEKYVADMEERARLNLAFRKKAAERLAAQNIYTKDYSALK